MKNIMNKNYIKYLLAVVLVVTLSSCSLFKKVTGDSKDKIDCVSSKTTQTDKKQTDEPIYTGRAMSFPEKSGIIFEDHVAFEKGQFNWNKDTTRTYDIYSAYIEGTLKKLGLYKENKIEYFIPEYKPEFEKLTNIKVGEKFNISSDKEVVPSEVIGYYVSLDDMIGAGAIFYVVLKSDVKDTLREKFFVCTKNSFPSKVIQSGIADKEKIKKFKSYIWDKVKKVRVIDDSSPQNKSYPIEGINDEDIKIYEGSFTEKGKTQYLVSYTKQLSFDSFASGVWIMDENGNVITAVSEMREKDFTYANIAAVVDGNGDGLYEIISEDGYYEGSCINMMKYGNGKFNTYATVLCFGV